MLLFSIIIPTCNRNDLLAKCLDMLAPNLQLIEANTYEVIVTDDGAQNNAKEFIEENYTWVKWVEAPKRGRAANRNNGAKYGKADWYIFIDDDCIPNTDILKQYQSALKIYPGCKAFEGAILPNSWDLLKNDMAECPINTEGGSFWSANICIEKTLFNSIGGFDEIFIHYGQEDQDLYLRLLKYSKIPFLANCKVVHPVRFVTLKSKLQSIDGSIINWYKFYQKYNLDNVRGIRRREAIKHLKLSIKNVLKGNIQSGIFHLVNVEKFLLKSSLFK